MKKRLKLISLFFYCLLVVGKGYSGYCHHRNVKEIEGAKERVSSLLEKLKNKNRA
jgi:hypothetical protein